MPTRATWSASDSASFTCRASAAYSASASRSEMGMFVEVLLKNDGRGPVVDALALPLSQHCRGIAFVDQRNGHAEAAVQLVGKAPAALRHFMRRAVRVARQSDYAQRRLPFADQLANR